MGLHSSLERSSKWVFTFCNILLCCASQAASLSAIEYQNQLIAVDKKEYEIKIPKGFQLELLTTNLDGPRLLTFAKNGDLFIGSKSGNVYRLPPPYTKSQVLLELDNYPHSVALRSGEILIAQTNGLYHAPYEAGQEKINERDVNKLISLPSGRGHNSRTVAIGPDGRIYLGLGITGNCSDDYVGDTYDFDRRRGGVLVLDETGEKPKWQPFASGLRNPVGFDWHPETGVMYASNNGPDHHGFEQPPEYFSRIEANSFHGMPWFQFDGEKIKRDYCIASDPPRPQAEVRPPVVTFPARNAPMGVAFVPKGALDKTFEDDAVVALRGSWGTQPNGGFFGAAATRRHPKLVIVRFENGEARRVEDLITGFQLNDGDRWARPVGVVVGPDGALYFTSDSETNGLFRLSKIKH